MKIIFSASKLVPGIVLVISIAGMNYFSFGEKNNLTIFHSFESDTIPVTQKKRPADTCYTIYLTFDDGPVKESEELVKIALKDSIPINLFVVGEKVFANDTMKRLFQSYFTNPFIEIGNHSFTHANKNISSIIKTQKRW